MPDESKPCWPNTSDWHALQDGVKVEFKEGPPFHVSVVDCGVLRVPSGKLVAIDPFAAMRQKGNAYVDIPPGDYPLRVTLADVSGKGDGSHIREAYATLILSDDAEVTRRALCPSPEGTDEETQFEPEEYRGFAVDAGTACLVDAEFLVSAMPDEQTWLETLFDNGEDDSWFERMDDPDHIRDGIAHIRLPLGKKGENLILFHTGWGDGIYPVVGGFSAAGKLVRVHLDFGIF